MCRLLLLSGPVGSGKSTLASALRDGYAARIIKTRELIVALMPEVQQTRSELQDAGDVLDARSAGAWVADGLATISPDEPLVIVDAVRRADQVDAIRARFPDVEVQHIHLQAPEQVLSARYEQRALSGDERTSYSEVRENATEAAVDDLARISDFLIDTSSEGRPEEVLVRAVGVLGL
jgi:adenylosuccinate synthase